MAHVVVADYYPGPIRQGLDELHTAASAFLADNPEFAGRPIEVVAQFMDRRAGYRTEAEAHTRKLLTDEGVPEGWEPEASEGDDVLTSDEL